MLVIRCRQGETLQIGDEVEVAVLALGSGKVKLGVNAPPRVKVLRKALEMTREQNIAASQIHPAEIVRLIHCCTGTASELDGAFVRAASLFEEKSLTIPEED